LLFLGILVNRLGKIWLLTLALSSFVHLVLDQMWTNPTTLWWPLLGPIPENRATDGWFAALWQGLLANPTVYISEAAGFLIVLSLALLTLRNGRLLCFLKTGSIG
jgi:hypothetical protein